MTFGAIVWAALMIFTLYLYKQQIYSSQEAFIRWGFEFLIGLRASITVTVLVSALEFFQNYASVKNHPIEWSLAAPAS
jgi:flagellar biosynthesis protein FliR